METTSTTLESPSIESFSYSWDLNPISTVDYPSHDHQDETMMISSSSFIEMDPRLPPSKRFLRVSSSDHFCFDFPTTDESPLGLVHADELISNGFVVPHFVNDQKSSSYDVIETDEKRSRCGPLRRFFRKYFKYLLRPFLYRYDRRMKWELSAATISPRTSLTDHDNYNWRTSCDSESSIYDAVLHCKRTQGK